MSFLLRLKISNRYSNFGQKLLVLSLSLASFAQIVAQTDGRSSGQGNRGGGNFDPKSMPAIGKISGIVADSTSGEVISFATITLASLMDSTYFTGGVTDEKGRFSISEIRVGAYNLTIDFLGFEKYSTKIRLNQKSGIDQNLGIIKLLATSINLQTAVVTADKPLIINGIDRKIFNVEKLATVAGGSATDVLRNVPLIQVDLDGNISMRGSDNLTVLIDGRPSGLTGAGRKALLESLPAGSVESIEVITNPSAKYDPDGTSGIVNIILKKNKLVGMNGSVQIGVGSREKYSLGGQFNYKKGRWNTYANYNFRLDNNFNRGTSTRENLENTQIFSVLDQKTAGDNRPLNNLIKIGADYQLRPKTILGISATTNFNQRTEDELFENRLLDAAKKLQNQSTRRTIQDGKNVVFDVNANLKHDFKDRGHNLVFDFSNSKNDGSTDRNFTNQKLDLNGSTADFDPFFQKTTTKNEFQLTSAQVDYTRPFGGKGKIETGAKVIFRTVNTDLGAFNFDSTAARFIDDATRTNEFVFDEKIYAAYLNLNRKFGKFGTQIGLRGESVRSESRLIQTAESFPNDYNSLFPSLFLTYDLSQKSTLGLNFSRRINRPQTDQLNPFADLNDTLNISRGNPFLKPEYVHSAEISSQFFVGNFTIVPMLFYRLTTDNISRFQYIDPVSGINIGTQVNLDRSDSYGFDVVLSGNIRKWWSISASTNGSFSQFNGANLGFSITNKNTFRMWNRLATNISLPKSWEIQLTTMFSPDSKVLLGTHRAMYSSDVAITKRFWQKNGSLSLRMGDIFDTRQFGMQLETPQFNRAFTRKRESRIAFLNFSWKFGKLTESKSRGQGRRGGGENGGGEEF